ncbi:MAG: STAS/SEC14 domain-containing protein [Roseiarcus sp.]
MIKAQRIADGILKVVAPTKLQSGDFAELARQIEPIIRQTGQLRLFIDASDLEGWKDLSALEEHAAFVKSHQEKVDRIAVIAAHEWQRWLVSAIKVFLHPEVRLFQSRQEDEALRWLKS